MGTFNVVETTIDEIHKAFESGKLTPRQLVQTYLDRIEAYDKKGPALNSIITVNPRPSRRRTGSMLHPGLVRSSESQ